MSFNVSKISEFSLNYILDPFKLNEENIEDAQKTVNEIFTKIDTKRIHDSVWLCAPYLDKANPETVVFIGSLKDAKKTIYYVGGENSCELEFYHDKFSVWTDPDERFSNYLENTDEETEEPKEES